MAFEWRNLRSLASSLLIIICLFLTSYLFLSQDPLGQAPDSLISQEHFTSKNWRIQDENQFFKKPDGFKIIAVVFCTLSPL
jgi:hypothetical protein